MSAVERALDNLRCARLTEEERQLFLSNKDAFVELAKSRGVSLRTLLADFRFELCKATGFVVLPAGQTGSALGGSRTLQ